MTFRSCKVLNSLYFLVIIISCEIITSLNVYSQIPAQEIKRQEWLDNLIELQNSYGVNKLLVPDFELASLIALSQFPELIPINIDMVYSKIRTTMQARPTIWFFLRRKEARVYKVMINSNEKKLKKGALKNIPFDAQVGILAHEFAHVLHYNTKSTLGLIGEGFRYWISMKFRSEFEKENDLETIKRGFGWQVFHFTDYLLNETDASEKYKAYKRKIYYSPDEVEEIIKNTRY